MPARETAARFPLPHSAGTQSRGTWNSGLSEAREHMPRKPLDGVERHTCPRGKRPPVSLCPTASAGVGAEGAAPPTRDWFLDMPRKPLDGVERHTCPRGKRPPVSLCPTASAGVGAEGAAPPTRDWFLGMPPGRPFFPKRAKRAGEPVPPPVGATPRARRVATRRAARPSVRSALRRSTRLYAVKGSVLPYLSKGGIV